MRQQHEGNRLNLTDFEKTLPPEKRWENLTLANDFIFGKIMRDTELCTEMIRRILPDMDIGHYECGTETKFRLEEKLHVAFDT